MEGYKDHVMNTIIDYCSSSSKDLAFRFILPRADLAAAVHDHDYFDLPFTECWIDTSLKVSLGQIEMLEFNTRSQRRSKLWTMERKWRLTASRFWDICKATERRNKTKLCSSLYYQLPLKTAAVIHGQQYETFAIEKF